MPANDANHHLSQPISSRDRITEIDVIRGFALLGVIWMNLFELVYFGVPPSVEHGFPTAKIDGIVTLLDLFLVREKAQFLFGTLFGLGFAIFLSRKRKAGSATILPYIRRVAALMCFGLLNLYFIFFGDVLHDYAIIAIVGAPAIFLPSEALLPIGLLLLAVDGSIAALASPYMTGMDLHTFMSVHRTMFLQTLWQAFTAHTPALLPRLGQVYLLTFNISPKGVDRSLHYAGQFLIGFWLYNSGMLENCRNYPARLRKFASLAIPTGFLLTAINLYMGAQKIKLNDFNDNLLHVTAVATTALGYGAAIAFVASRRPRAMRFIAAYGQTALTNYLIQGMFILFLMSDSGFGLIHSFGAAYVLMVAFAIATVQAIASYFWLKSYRFGPAEWLWRCVTYWSWQPMRSVPHQQSQEREGRIGTP